MDKTAIKNFSIWARRKLISEITYKAGMIGISEQGIVQPLPISTNNIQFFDIGTHKPTEISNGEIKQRKALISRIREKESTSDYKTAFQFVMEEVAYTWFNRLVAIRFMEVNEYLPSRVRVLSSETQGKSEPDMVTTPFETDMDFTPYETDRIMQLKDENKLDELFRMLFIKQCNKLNEVLPELFEKTSDYTEFLLNISFTDKDGIVSHLVNDIAEEDFTEAVEIIGWLYQYYNTEPKEDVFALLKKNVKITKERIPAATQLFTPDWIVRYMVENSLGRLWIERERAMSEVSDEYLNGSYFGWKYYLEEAGQEEDVKIELEKIREEYKKLKPEDIKVIDPCMGSGHILVYAFDVLMQIYESQGYTQRDAVQAIIENNLYGLDIDDRAYQLAYFAVMMKARKYDRQFLKRRITPKLYSIQESNNIKKLHLKYFGNALSDMERNMAVQQMEYLLDTFQDAKVYGSILNIDDCNWDLLNRFVNDFNIAGQISMDSVGAEQSQSRMKEIISIAEVMAQKYDVIVTNPPYMGGSGMNPKVSEYVKKNYPDSKSDLFAVFIEKCLQMTRPDFYTAMITQHAFMFLSSYEKLRGKLFHNDFINMAHLGARAFEEISGEVVQTTSFVMRKSNLSSYKATFSRLVDYNSQHEKENAFLAKQNLHIAQQENFSKIPGTPIAYWVSSGFQQIFTDGDEITNFVSSRDGLTTGNNDLFIKQFWEVQLTDIQFGCNNAEAFWGAGKKYAPLIKGGLYRKWYGNNWFVITYDNVGFDRLSQCGNKLPSREIYFIPYITWNRISTRMAFRYCEAGYLFESASLVAFSKNKENMLYALAFANSVVANSEMQLINPTTNMLSGYFDSLRIPKQQDHTRCIELVTECVDLTREDWNAFETSWDFKNHPLVPSAIEKAEQENSQFARSRMEKFSRLSWQYANWDHDCTARFNQLKINEQELNRIFINIYGLGDELTSEVEEKDVTVRRADRQRDIKSFISYAVGCMFGRYSLDVESLAYAGGDWDDSKYTTFIPDKDNCIPITDEEYLEDDIVGLFVAFVKKVYGIETLEENLDFIAQALGNKGNTSREIIRNYFIKDFYKDHVKIYQKRPIYWLYDSGKQDGFKGLIYMHRYTADTTGIVRVDYLHKMQKIYIGEIDRMQDMVDNSTNPREVAQAEKRKEKLIKQLKETKEYDEKIAHIALSRIEIDLDDGVKVNYEKVQTGQDGKKLSILGKI